MNAFRSRKIAPMFLFALLLAGTLLLASRKNAPAQGSRRPETKESFPQTAQALSSLIVQDMDSGITAEDMAQALVGSGVTISNTTYTGLATASGVFSGGDGIIGFESGILLTSGTATNVVGPNVSDSITGYNFQAGDADLTELSGFDTYDAAVLEFDFVPNESTVFFQFVFASDEYNEYVNTEYNDVFAFFVNGTNCALVESDPVTINTINYGNPYGITPYSHPELYINNDLEDGGGFLDTEMDGLTKVLTCSASVDKGGTNHLKLAIADASDSILDSAVFLQAESLTSANVVELTGLEITQAVQDLTNDVDLIAGKTTYVRAHVRSASGATVYNVQGKLIGRQGGEILLASPLSPQNPGANIDVLASPDRGQLNQSFYFRLPDSWAQGTIEVEFVGLTHEVECRDVASTSNDCKATVTFLEMPVPEISIIGIRWEDSANNLHDPNLADYEAIVQDFEAEHPVSELVWDRPYELADWVDDGGPPDEDGVLSSWDLGDVLTKLANRRTIDDVDDAIYYGLLVDYPSGADLGLGSRPGWQSAGFYRASDPTTFAHEVGHNLNRKHVNCSGSEASVDSSYPYTGGRISQNTTGNNAYYGFHISTQQIFDPGTGDLMGYCRPRWVSDYTYEAMRSRIDTTWDLPLFSPMLSLVETDVPAVLVAGIVEVDGSAGDITDIYQITATKTMTPNNGDFSIVLKDGIGTNLAVYDFDPGQPSEGTESVFSFLLPWENGAEQIVLLYQGAELDQHNASSNPPEVNITSPITATNWTDPVETVTWIATDSDGDDLTFAIQYSPDGGVSWQTLTTGESGTSYAVSRATLPGSSSARIRILASDGFQTGEDVSDLFTSALNAPEVLITEPISGSFAVEDQLIFFGGTGLDPEDGLMVDDQLTWVSNLDGPIGTGRLLSTNALSMTEGVHLITLIAEDNDMMTAEDLIQFEIFRERPQLPPRLAINSNGLTVLANVGTAPFIAHNFTVANEGDGAIAWEASADVDWISFSNTKGFAPGAFAIAIDVDGLLPGEYHGTVTVTGDGSENSPQTVDVWLTVLSSPNKLFLPTILKH